MSNNRRSRQIMTSELLEETIWEELDWLCNYLESKHVQQVHLTFGFAWESAVEVGCLDFLVKPTDIRGKVRELQDSGEGKLGSDNLSVTFGDVEVEYCHESDIHVWFDQRNDLVNDLHARLTQIDAKPRELLWVGSDNDADNWKPGAVLWEDLTADHSCRL